MPSFLQNAIINVREQPHMGLFLFNFLFTFFLLYIIIPRRKQILLFLGRHALNQVRLLPGRLFAFGVWAINKTKATLWDVSVLTGVVTLRPSRADLSYIIVLRPDSTDELVRMQDAFE
ncbi:uncharacterized protein IWZ02DRAFT_488044 [Phyllosticta citriasiana]|uniref:uncharacterized protein n=1 Tax=Phyllosticta citriasiana TaxID=595635 RepID=UPI0030FD9D99